MLVFWTEAGLALLLKKAILCWRSSLHVYGGAEPGEAGRLLTAMGMECFRR